MSVSFSEVANKYSALSSTLSDRTAYHSSHSYSNVEYIWIDDVSSAKLLSKTQKLEHNTCRSNVSNVYIKEITKLTFNINAQRPNGCLKNIGLLQPVFSSLHSCTALHRDPFRREANLECNRMTLCETFLSNDEPTASTKSRMECQNLMNSKKVSEFQCQFKIEQEFSFREIPAITSIFHKDHIRKTLESFNRACNYAGLSTNGFSIENHPKGFLSYTIGPCSGLEVSNKLWMSRYVLQRVAEEFHLTPYFGPVIDNCQVCCPRALYSFSTQKMRVDGGIYEAKIYIRKMRERHMQDLKSYNSTCTVTEADLWKRDVVGEFSEVVIIPLLTQKDGKGCIEDCRPRGNSDPYVVTKTIVATACL